MAGNNQLLEYYATDSPESKLSYVRKKKSFLQSALSVLLLVFVNKTNIKARHKTSKECDFSRFLVRCNSSLPLAFASSKYFARRRLGSPTSSIAENETTGFTVGLIFQTGKPNRIYRLRRRFVPDQPSPFLSYDTK
jgi:hypothetical protein